MGGIALCYGFTCCYKSVKKNPVAFGNNRVFLTNKIWQCGSGRHIVGMKVLCSTYIRNRHCKPDASLFTRNLAEISAQTRKMGQRLKHLSQIDTLLWILARHNQARPIILLCCSYRTRRFNAVLRCRFIVNGATCHGFPIDRIRSRGDTRR